VQRFPSTAPEQSGSVGLPGLRQRLPRAQGPGSADGDPGPPAQRAGGASLVICSLKCGFKCHPQMTQRGPCSLPLSVQDRSPCTCCLEPIPQQQEPVLGSQRPHKLFAPGALYPGAGGFAEPRAEDIGPLPGTVPSRGRPVCGWWVPAPPQLPSLPAQPVLPASRKESAVIPVQTGAGLAPGSGRGSAGAGVRLPADPAAGQTLQPEPGPAAVPQAGDGQAWGIPAPRDPGDAKSDHPTSGKRCSPAAHPSPTVTPCPAGHLERTGTRHEAQT